MDNNITDICNSNNKNTCSNEIYDHFNKFIFSSDIKVLGKLLYRYHFFNKVIDLPGDIVEIGVFKGSGVASFLKMIEIFSPNSIKKVIGFDLFYSDVENILDQYSDIDKKYMNTVLSRVDTNLLSIENVSKELNNVSPNKNYILVKGDIEKSAPLFLKENPGLRISLLYIDVDIERPTYYSLKYLWDRILPGGIILFDEYGFHKFTESNGFEKFANEFKIKYELKSTGFFSPSAYIIKST